MKKFYCIYFQRKSKEKPQGPKGQKKSFFVTSIVTKQVKIAVWGALSSCAITQSGVCLQDVCHLMQPHDVSDAVWHRRGDLSGLCLHTVDPLTDWVFSTHLQSIWNVWSRRSSSFNDDPKCFFNCSSSCAATFQGFFCLIKDWKIRMNYYTKVAFFW